MARTSQGEKRSRTDILTDGMTDHVRTPAEWGPNKLDIKFTNVECCTHILSYINTERCNSTLC